jgi:hypothetical protein
MNNKANIILLSFLFLGFTTYAETIEKEFKVSPGKTLSVELKTGGSLIISGWNKDVVKVKGTVGGRDASDCKVEIEDESGGVHISSYFSGRKNRRSADLDFEINVPNKFNLDLETMGGGITIDNVDGKMEGKTMGGKLNLTNLKGKLSLITMGGKITLTNSDVDGTVKTMGGEVLVQDVTGDVKATSQGGNVTQKNVKRRSGEGVGGEVHIKTMGGDINVDDAPEGADVHTMGGDIHVKKAAQFARAKTMGGDINIDAIDGGAEATTMGGDVTITMVGDPEKGDRSVNIESMGGDITLTVPAKLSMNIDITLAYTKNRDGDYKIVSDFDVKQEETKEWERSHGSSRKYIYGTGTISGGKNKIRIKTINGNVYLKKG